MYMLLKMIFKNIYVAIEALLDGSRRICVCVGMNTSASNVKWGLAPVNRLHLQCLDASQQNVDTSRCAAVT